MTNEIEVNGYTPGEALDSIPIDGTPWFSEGKLFLIGTDGVLQDWLDGRWQRAPRLVFKPRAAVCRPPPPPRRMNADLRKWLLMTGRVAVAGDCRYRWGVIMCQFERSLRDGAWLGSAADSGFEVYPEDGKPWGDK